MPKPGIATAVSSIFGNFQMARLEGTMNAVELNTRISSIHDGHLLEQANNYWPKLADLTSPNGAPWSIHKVLTMIQQTSLPSIAANIRAEVREGIREGLQGAKFVADGRQIGELAFDWAAGHGATFS